MLNVHLNLRLIKSNRIFILFSKRCIWTTNFYCGSLVLLIYLWKTWGKDSIKKVVLLYSNVWLNIPCRFCVVTAAPCATDCFIFVVEINVCILRPGRVMKVRCSSSLNLKNIVSDESNLCCPAFWSRAQFLNLVQKPASLKSSGWRSPGGSWSISPFQPGDLWIWARIQENTAQSQALQYSLTNLRHAELSAPPADVGSWFESFSAPVGKITSSKWLKVLV